MAYTPEEIARKRKEIKRRERAQATRNRERTLLRSRPSEADLARLVETFERTDGFASRNRTKETEREGFPT